MAERCDCPIGDSDDGQEEWAFGINPAVKDLLDHVAQELAREYVRLVREGSAEESPMETDRNREVKR